MPNIPLYAFARIKMRPVASLVFSVRNSVFGKLAIFLFLQKLYVKMPFIQIRF